MGAELLAGIQAGANMLSQGAQAFLQTKGAIMQRLWNQQDYNRQRKDALADWQMQADYNSPKAQMQRLREAGLNPNLVYGNGADAQMASPVRSSTINQTQYPVPKIDLGGVANGAIETYMDVTMRQQQLDNLQKQGVLLDQQFKNMAAQEFKIYADTNKSVSQTAGQDIKNKYAPAIAEYSLEGMQTAIEKATAETDYTRVKTAVALDANERAELSLKSTLEVNAARVLTMRAQRLRMEIQNLESQQNISHSMADERKILAQKQLLLQQQSTVEKQQDNLNQIIRLNKARADYQESVPTWTEQELAGAVENLLGNLLKMGGKQWFPNRTERSWENYSPAGKSGGQSYEKRY